jgi:rod shape determining protein RodA
MSSSNQELHLIAKLKEINLPFVIVLSCIYFVGLLNLFSASNGQLQPWPIKHILYAVVASPIMLTIILTHPRFWYKYSYHIYGVCLAALVATFIIGVEGGLGAQRWLSIAGFRFQPSEFMKVGLVLAIAKYFHILHYNNIHKLYSLVIPGALIGAAAGLVLIQPNLGTASIICMVGAMMIFAAGLSWKKIIFVLVCAAIAMPVLWTHMKDYQKQRVATFLDPESDPLGAGYNIIQSKIAIGSGGFFGKGYMEGTQSRLNFVPEQETDFIFSVVTEEFGFVGGMTVIFLYAAYIIIATRIALACRSSYCKFVALGMCSIVFIHTFINIGMVMGILPVVGVPLLILSYGGSSLIATLLASAFILNAYVHRDEYVTDEEDEDEFV